MPNPIVPNATPSADSSTLAKSDGPSNHSVMRSGQSFGQESPEEPQNMIVVCCEERWQVYHRLQELDIPCQCKSFKPLQATVQTPTAAVQVWSIVRRVSQPRQSLANSLNQSWRLPCARVSRS
ncbi:MAG: Asr1405/Asl0597 family protein [Cyanobacteria bacterium P01_A01_bin.116]